ncbi:MAG: hypothetical protein IJR13_06015, partial [Bacteroidales bacterium]|nr:hypothetical protein [Bacteroidales bacterium]
SITSNNDTIYQIDTIYSIVNNRDTIHSFDTIYHQTTNTDTVYQITSQRDTVYQITSNTDTIYSITSNNDTIYQIDTIYSIVNNRDTIHSFDTIYHQTTNTDTVYQVTTNRDTLYLYDTIYQITSQRDTVYQYDTIYQLTTNTDTIYQLTTQRDTIYSQCDYSCLDSVRHIYDSLISQLTHVIDSLRNTTPTDPCLGHSTTGIETHTACDSYIWHGTTYTASTTTPTYTITGGNAAGCDSTVMLQLTINHSTTGIDEQTASGNYTWHGTTYTASTTTPTYTITGGNSKGCDSVVTLHLTITSSTPPVGDMEGCECTGTVAVDGVLPGQFSVSATKKVKFSQGNLQYTTQGTHACADGTTKQGTWRFADCQCQYVGASNSNTSATYTGYIDFFGWGTSGYHNSSDIYNTNYYPYSTSMTTVNTSYNRYGYGPSTNMSYLNLTDGSRYYDWGVYNAIANGGNIPNRWRTLTKDELVYLFNTRSGSTIGGTANARYCMATVSGVNGIVLFPDSYSHPSSAPIPVSCNTSNVGYTANPFTAMAWQTMEAAGAVFLPAAGYRYGTSIHFTGTNGYYWSSSYGSIYGACTLDFNTSLVNPQGYYIRNYGFSVRLVHELADPCLGNTSSATDIQNACDSYTWIDGNTYTESTTTPTYTITGGNAAGCDSTVMLQLTINHSTTGIDEQTASGSYTWHGTTYTASTTTPTYTITGGNSKGCDSVVTLHLTITSSTPPAGDMEGCQCTGTVAVDGVLPGQFSVSATKKVKFSQGNLQYTTQGTHACADGTTKQGTWRFADCQCQYVGASNSNISATYTGYIDLFGWGTSGYHNSSDSYNTNYYPYSTSTATVNESYNRYGYGPSTNMSSPNLTDGSRYYDWGVYNAIANGGNAPNRWRTLTSAEWIYLFNTRSGSTIGSTTNVRYCKATVSGVNGIVLFPDSYSHPSSAPIPASCNTPSVGYTTNTFTATAWQAMEVAGAVFLPAAGYRYGTGIYGAGTNGYYWSSSFNNSSNAYDLFFNMSLVYPQYNLNRYYGISVRLVQE